MSQLNMEKLKKLDAELRVIESPSKEYPKWVTKVAVFQSLGERGEELLTLTYKDYPKIEDIEDEIKHFYKEAHEEFYNSEGEMMLGLSYTGETQAEAISLLAEKGVLA